MYRVERMYSITTEPKQNRTKRDTTCKPTTGQYPRLSHPYKYTSHLPPRTSHLTPSTERRVLTTRSIRDPQLLLLLCQCLFSFFKFGGFRDGLLLSRRVMVEHYEEEKRYRKVRRGMYWPRCSGNRGMVEDGRERWGIVKDDREY
jgi:hypothetical protein